MGWIEGGVGVHDERMKVLKLSLSYLILFLIVPFPFIVWVTLVTIPHPCSSSGVWHVWLNLVNQGSCVDPPLLYHAHVPFGPLDLLYAWSKGLGKCQLVLTLPTLGWVVDQWSGLLAFEPCAFYLFATLILFISSLCCLQLWALDFIFCCLQPVFSLTPSFINCWLLFCFNSK